MNFLAEKLMLNTQHGMDCTVEVCKPGYPDDDELIYKGSVGDCLRYIMEYELPMDGGSYFSFTTNQGNYCGYSFAEVSWQMGFQPAGLREALEKSLEEKLTEAQNRAGSAQRERQPEKELEGL